MPYGLLLLLLDVALIVHAVKSGRNTIWIMVILMLPGIGAVTYAAVEILPEYLGSPKVRRAQTSFAKKLNPIGPVQRAEGPVDGRRHHRQSLGLGGRSAEHRPLRRGLDAISRHRRHADGRRARLFPRASPRRRSARAIFAPRPSRSRRSSAAGPTTTPPTAICFTRGRSKGRAGSTRRSPTMPMSPPIIPASSQGAPGAIAGAAWAGGGSQNHRRRSRRRPRASAKTRARQSARMAGRREGVEPSRASARAILPFRAAPTMEGAA